MTLRAVERRATLVIWGGSRSQPLVIAHRGASRWAPENSLAAFRIAHQQGADGGELDVIRWGSGDQPWRRSIQLLKAANIGSRSLTVP